MNILGWLVCVDFQHCLTFVYITVETNILYLNIYIYKYYFITTVIISRNEHSRLAHLIRI